MRDILLATVIGGVIGIIASAVMGLLQGLYSLRGKREENLSRERQQSTHIQHERDSQILARRIAVRARYLEPLATHLAALHSSLADFQRDTYRIITTYRTAEAKIQVTEERKAEFYTKLSQLKAPFNAICIQSDNVSAAMSQVIDDQLTRNYSTLLDKMIAFYQADAAIYNSFTAYQKDKDLVCDLQPLIDTTISANFAMSAMHKRIESLLAGLD